MSLDSSACSGSCSCPCLWFDEYASPFCNLPYLSPIHIQPPLNSPHRKAYDVEQTEALAKLALELNAPIDRTIQSAFERLTTLTGTKEFLPVASKVLKYLNSVAWKRREWCCEFCMKPYTGDCGEGVYGGIGREDQVCGNTYIVPPAVLRGIDPEHQYMLEQVAARYPELLNDSPSHSEQPLVTPPATDAFDEDAIEPDSQQPFDAFLVADSRSCCSVDVAVFDAIGASVQQNIYDPTAIWLEQYLEDQRLQSIERELADWRIREQWILQQKMLLQSEFDVYSQLISHQQQLTSDIDSNLTENKVGTGISKDTALGKAFSEGFQPVGDERGQARETVLAENDVLECNASEELPELNVAALSSTGGMQQKSSLEANDSFHGTFDRSAAARAAEI
ncbi:hypothetical protein HDU84_000952 [Entophlyctis sp. JEL0112]|nr:hypothetical protein HDU84_000952 [Entophlyctis sp. JEL0112]